MDQNNGLELAKSLIIYFNAVYMHIFWNHPVF